MFFVVEACDDDRKRDFFLVGVQRACGRSIFRENAPPRAVRLEEKKKEGRPMPADFSNVHRQTLLTLERADETVHAPNLRTPTR